MNTWTMHVENFGKIKSADIEVAPMTLFVGDNNSGKSYIMTLIYGLLNVHFYFEDFQFNEQSESFVKCIKFIDEICANFDEPSDTLEEVEIPYENVKSFEGVLNELLSLNKDRFIENLFNNRIDIGDLRLEFKTDSSYTLLCGLSYTAGQTECIQFIGVSGKNHPIFDRGGRVEKRGNSYDYKKLVSFIVEHMITENFGFRSTYFPTARTGYVLTYKALIESALRDKFNLSMTQKNLLTRPNSDFLTRLSQITRSDLADGKSYFRERTQAAISIIENNIIQGKVSVSDMPAQDILYHPQGTDAQLPMFVTSGVVTEMTPLVLFFGNEIIQTVLIEEPEISLHPQLQCEMARVLIRLVNAEIPVFATTHSDIILQHINNMIKLEAASNRKIIAEKLGYEECDWMDREKVNVYQFDVDDSQSTTVTKLPCGEFGFEAMTFYNTMEELNRQTMVIEED